MKAKQKIAVVMLLGIFSAVAMVLGAKHANDTNTSQPHYGYAG